MNPTYTTVPKGEDLIPELRGLEIQANSTQDRIKWPPKVYVCAKTLISPSKHKQPEKHLSELSPAPAEATQTFPGVHSPILLSCK